MTAEKAFDACWQLFNAGQDAYVGAMTALAAGDPDAANAMMAEFHRLKAEHERMAATWRLLATHPTVH